MNLTDITGNMKRTVGGASMLLGAALIMYAGYSCGKGSAAGQVADLTTKLAKSEKTIEVKDGLYSTTIVELSNVKGLLDGSQKEVSGLKKQLADSQAQLLTAQQLTVKWKNAYESALTAHQGDGGKGTDGNGNPVERKSVEFTGDLGPIHASGHTLTDPPEAYLKLEQVRPLVLTVAVAKNKDGTWQSYVTSSEPNMQVAVNLAGVDTGVTSPTWLQRIWLDTGVDFYAGRRAGIGLSYHFDRWSAGVNCSVWEGGQGCGATLGFRLFK